MLKVPLKACLATGMLVHTSIYIWLLFTETEWLFAHDRTRTSTGYLSGTQGLFKG